MKVKNGIASSVSFDMMPQTRSGSGLQEVRIENRPSSMPMSAKVRPTKASANATG